MQYFSIIAHFSDERGRTCAMLQDTTLVAAADKASELVRAEHLGFVKRGSTFTIRRSTRRETALLQSFLGSCTGATFKTYTKEDTDALLARRNSLLLSFFMGLYLDPAKLKARFEAAPAGPATSGSITGASEGSGGIEVNSSALDHIDQAAAIAEAGDALLSDMPSEEIPVATDEEAPISDDNQMAALGALLEDRGDDQKDDDSFLDLD